MRHFFLHIHMCSLTPHKVVSLFNAVRTCAINYMLYIQEDFWYAWKVTSCVPQTAPMGVILNNSVSQIKERRIMELLSVIWALNIMQTIDTDDSLLNVCIWLYGHLNTIEIWDLLRFLETNWIIPAALLSYLKPHDHYIKIISSFLQACDRLAWTDCTSASQLLLPINTHWVPVVCEVDSVRI